MKLSLNCSKPFPPELKDTVSLSKILRMCKEGETFFTMAPEKKVRLVARHLGCKVDTRRHEIRNFNKLEQITYVTVEESVGSDKAPVFPCKPHQKKTSK